MESSKREAGEPQRHGRGDLWRLSYLVLAGAVLLTLSGKSGVGQEVAGEVVEELGDEEVVEQDPPIPGAGVGGVAAEPAAEEEPEDPPVRPGFPGRPGGFPGAAPGAAPGGFAGEEGGSIVGDQVTLQFPNNPATDLLAIYERLTEKTLIKDTAIFQGTSISLVTPRPVTRQQAIRYIEATLLLNGYVLVPGPDEQSMKIVSAAAQGQGRAAFADGSRLYEAASDLPMDESVVTFFMRLEYLDPERAAEIFANHVGLHSFGRITPVLNPPGLLLTENASMVRQLLDIKSIVDAETLPAKALTEFIQLEHADAVIVAQIIQSTLEARAREEAAIGRTITGQALQPQAEGGQPQQGGGGGQPQRGERSAEEGASNGVAGPGAQLLADDRLNRILVIADPADFIYVASLVKEFDQPLPMDKPYERRLNHVLATDVLAALVDSMRSTSQGTVTLPDGTTINTRQDPLTSASTAALTGSGSLGNQPTIQTAQVGVDGPGDQIIEPQQDNAPVSVVIGKTRIIANPPSNAILVFGSGDDIRKVDEILDMLDQRPPQVYLATIIGELTITDGLDFGVDYITRFFSGNDGGGSGSLMRGRPELTGGAIADMRDNIITSPFGPANGLNLYGMVGDELDIFITALERTEKFKVLSRPSVYALNNKRATIASGQRIPVPQSTLTSAGNNVIDNANITTNIVYEDVVLKLEVLPRISSEGEVTLAIAQINDTVVGSQRVGENDVPIVGTENLTTTVTVPHRQTVVLGGLIKEQTRDVETGVPFLRRIPVLGRAFESTNQETTRKELIIFIQPFIVEDGDELMRASLGEDLRTGIGAEGRERFPVNFYPELPGQPGTAKPVLVQPGMSDVVVPAVPAVVPEVEETRRGWFPGWRRSN
jgi:general secretion pathway protein D